MLVYPGEVPGRRLLDADVTCDERLARMLFPYRDRLADWLKHAASVVQFARELKELLFQIMLQPSAHTDVSCDSTSKRAYHAALSKLVDSAGHLPEAYGSLQGLTIKSPGCITFRIDLSRALGSSNHSVEFLATRRAMETCFHYSYKLCAPKRAQDERATEGDDLDQLLMEAVQGLRPFGNFWRFLDEFDAQYWVLEPPLPASRELVYRKVALTGNLSLYVEFNVNNPEREPPGVCRIMGPSKLAGPLQQSLNALYELKPTSSETVVDAIERLLNMSLRRKTSEHGNGVGDASLSDPVGFECGICYSYYLLEDEGLSKGEQTPSIYCSNAQCHKAFHYDCIYDCFEVSGKSRTLFNRLSGDCPYCTQAITFEIKYRE